MKPKHNSPKLLLALLGVSSLLVPAASAAVQAVSSVLATPADPLNPTTPDPDLRLDSVTNASGTFLFTAASVESVGSSTFSLHAVNGSGSDANRYLSL